MFANKLVILIVLGCFLSQSVQGNIIDTIKNDMEKVSEEIVAGLLAESSQLQAIMAQVATQDTKDKMNDVSGCSKLFNDLQEGEDLVKQAVEMGMDTAKAFKGGIDDMLKCASLDFVTMGKCIIADVNKLKQLIVISKAGADSIVKDFKACGANIKQDWRVCIGKAPAKPSA